MPTVKPPADSTRAFRNESLFEAWLKKNHAKKSELYLRIYKKDSGVATVTYAQALDVALCWGWIDGLKKSYDDKSFLQRFTPRKSKSLWSKLNCEHVVRLITQGRMTPVGQKHVDAAKADGRWERAYASSSQVSVPDDLKAAIEAEPEALKTFRTLNRQNVYALTFRIVNIKTPAKRAERIVRYVEMLKQGQSIYPNGPTKEAARTGAVRAAQPRKTVVLVPRSKVSPGSSESPKQRRKSKSATVRT